MKISRKYKRRFTLFPFNKVLFLLLLPLLADVLIACCSCSDPQYVNYSHCELSVVNLDNSGAQAQRAGGNVLKEAYGMRLTISRSPSICQARALPSIFTTPAMAIACSCSDENYRYLENIQLVNITTLNAFDDDYPAGSDVTDLFRVFYDYNYYSLYEIGSLNRTYGHIAESITLDLLLMNPPQNGGEFVFRIDMTLSDERSLTVDSQPIILN